MMQSQLNVVGEEPHRGRELVDGHAIAGHRVALDVSLNSDASLASRGPCSRRRRWRCRFRR
jgi:hypothetical protein